MKEEGSFSNQDGLMKKTWVNLINLPLVYFKKSKENRAKCIWSPLPKGWSKLNFDGAICGNPGIAGIRCIINNNLGHWLAKKAMAIRPTSNNIAEVEALESGLLLCMEVGVTKVVIEGNSQIILNAVRKCSTPNQVINSKLDGVLNLLNNFEDYQICHIYREGNYIVVVVVGRRVEIQVGVGSFEINMTTQGTIRFFDEKNIQKG